jgi:hypothetical protein
MKYLFALGIILMVSTISAQNAITDYLVSDINQTGKIAISAETLNILAKEYGQTTNFTELSVQKVSEHYVLLAKEMNKKWIYAFELKNNDSKLYIDTEKHINACESQTMSILIFHITDGEIDGCKKFNHHILGRN